jgi:hypothetical protein
MTNTAIDLVLDEDFLRDEINDHVDYTIEDEGIGYYEYGDGYYTHEDIQMRIVDSSTTISYPCDVETIIFTEIRGTKEGCDENERDYECDWVAELFSVEWNGSTKEYDAKYSIRED